MELETLNRKNVEVVDTVYDTQWRLAGAPVTVPTEDGLF